MYTFTVISYNEEEYILQALESIRYQIEKYGKGRTFQLIIADDHSTDKTREYVEYWLFQYGYLFEEINRIYQEKNMGTSANVADAMKSIHGDLFFSTAGDDMLACTDIFTILEKYSDFDVLASTRLILQDDKIVINKRRYADTVAQSLYTTKYISWSVGLGCPIQAGAAWNKKLNTDSVLKYMMKFRLLDDRPRYYAIWKQEAPINYKYVNMPFLIYRKNKFSATSFSGQHKSVLNEDLELFFKMSNVESSHILYKFCAFLQMHSVRLRGRGIISYIRYFTPYYVIEETKRLIHYRKMNHNFQTLMANYLEDNKIYVSHIKREAERVRQSYEATRE